MNIPECRRRESPAGNAVSRSRAAGDALVRDQPNGSLRMTSHPLYLTRPSS